MRQTFDEGSGGGSNRGYRIVMMCMACGTDEDAEIARASWPKPDPYQRCTTCKTLNRPLPWWFSVPSGPGPNFTHQHR